MLEFEGLFLDSLGLVLKSGFGPGLKYSGFFSVLVLEIVFGPSWK